MAATSYTTDLTAGVITTAETTTGWSALGGGQSGLNDETDYFIQGNQCVSKNGFTASTRGQIFSAGATTIASGDAVFVWAKQNNRNLMQAQASGGFQVLIGSGTNAFDQFFVDGNDSEGSNLAGWRTYAVDPAATPSTTTGNPTGTSWFGGQWNIGGSGSLKGAPNAIDVIRHGRELRITDGDLANGYATFDGAATEDSQTANAWGIITPIQGGYLFHGHLVMGQSGTPVDFRDSNRSVIVLDDSFVSSTFNEMSIVDASSVVQWTNIQISHLGTTAPLVLTLNEGTFTGLGCRFDGCGTTTFSSSQSCQNSTWANSGQITHAAANLSGSTVTGYTGTANSSAVVYDVAADPDGEMDNMTFEMGSTATHAIEFGLNSPIDMTLRDCDFTGYGSTNDANDSVFEFKRTTGTVNLNLVGCTTDGSFSYQKPAGLTVNIIIDPVTTLVTVIDAVDKSVIQGARVLVTAAAGGPLTEGATIISAISDVNGQASDSRTLASDQPITGKIRLSSTPGSLYKQGNISGTISSTSGFSTTVQMIPDE